MNIPILNIPNLLFFGLYRYVFFLLSYKSLSTFKFLLILCIKGQYIVQSNTYLFNVDMYIIKFNGANQYLEKQNWTCDSQWKFVNRMEESRFYNLPLLFGVFKLYYTCPLKWHQLLSRVFFHIQIVYSWCDIGLYQRNLLRSYIMSKPHIQLGT